MALLDQFGQRVEIGTESEAHELGQVEDAQGGVVARQFPRRGRHPPVGDGPALGKTPFPHGVGQGCHALHIGLAVQATDEQPLADGTFVHLGHHLHPVIAQRLPAGDTIAHRLQPRLYLGGQQPH